MKPISTSTNSDSDDALLELTSAEYDGVKTVRAAYAAANIHPFVSVQAEPSAALDDSIRAAARRAVRAGPKVVVDAPTSETIVKAPPLIVQSPKKKAWFNQNNYQFAAAASLVGAGVFAVFLWREAPPSITDVANVEAPQAAPSATIANSNQVLTEAPSIPSSTQASAQPSMQVTKGALEKPKGATRTKDETIVQTDKSDVVAQATQTMQATPAQANQVRSEKLDKEAEQRRARASELEIKREEAPTPVPQARAPAVAAAPAPARAPPVLGSLATPPAPLGEAAPSLPKPLPAPIAPSVDVQRRQSPALDEAKPLASAPTVPSAEAAPAKGGGKLEPAKEAKQQQQPLDTDADAAKKTVMADTAPSGNLQLKKMEITSAAWIEKLQVQLAAVHNAQTREVFEVDFRKFKQRYPDELLPKALAAEWLNLLKVDAQKTDVQREKSPP